MGYDLITNIESCHTNIPSLLYYSHIPPAIIALFFGIFILLKGKGNRLAKKIFFSISVTFFIWIVVEGTIWLLYNSINMMFLWSFLGLLYALMHILSLYFVYVMIDQKDVSLKIKGVFAILLLPIIYLTPTIYNIVGFDIENCQAIEGSYFIAYRYFVGIVSIIWISLLLYFRYKKAEKESKKQILLLGFGILSFLFLFSWSEIVGSITENFNITQYGLFGMPILMAFLAFLIVRYHTFNIKVIGTQALVLALIILIAATFLVGDPFYSEIIMAVTLVLVIGLGYSLTQSVKKEVIQREKIEKLARELGEANEKLKELDQLKSEFLSLATHQIRAPLTAIKGYSSMLLEGDFGVLPQKAKDSIDTIMKSCQNLINIVGDFLNISRIEQGRMVYEKSIFDIGELVQEVANELKPNIQNAGLSLEIEIPNNFSAKVNADKGKIKQVIGNIIDNAIKYTPHGNIKVSIFKEQNKIKIAVKDSGVGIDPSEIDKLFTKFSRTKDASKTNVTGTGLGLYIAKKMAEAHQGDIKVSSEGVGKGTTFTIELPIV